MVHSVFRFKSIYRKRHNSHKKRHCLTAMYQFALLAKKKTPLQSDVFFGVIYLFFHVFSAKLPQMCYERIIDQYLSEWATRATHKPVLLRGARQDSESVIILNLQFLADIEIIMKAIVIFIDDTHTTIGRRDFQYLQQMPFGPTKIV